MSCTGETKLPFRTQWPSLTFSGSQSSHFSFLLYHGCLSSRTSLYGNGFADAAILVVPFSEPGMVCYLCFLSSVPTTQWALMDVWDRRKKHHSGKVLLCKFSAVGSMAQKSQRTLQILIYRTHRKERGKPGIPMSIGEKKLFFANSTG